MTRAGEADRQFATDRPGDVSPRRILFIGAGGINARLRVESLVRQGHDVTEIRYSDLSWFSDRVLTKSMRWGFDALVDRHCRYALARHPALAGSYDLAFLNQARFFGPLCYELLRERATRIVEYINDDPFGHQADSSWRLVLQTLPLNDVVAVSRGANVAEAHALGARSVVRVGFPADEVMHRPLDLTEAERRKWASDVLFIGTCFADRGYFLRELIQAGVPVTVFGSGWRKSPDWPVIQPYHRGDAIYGLDYVRAIQCCKVAIGLLSKQNRDQCTRRSSEIPAIGTLLCAERTSEHLAMYDEDEEAVFFDDAAECAAKCLALLANDSKRNLIASRGHARFLRDGTTNRSMLAAILAAAFVEDSPVALIPV